jgi:hypothetical protein
VPREHLPPMLRKFLPAVNPEAASEEQR